MSLMIISVIFSGCEDPPEIETCILGESVAQCIDTRQDPAKFERKVSEMVNYIAHPADDWNALIQFCRRQAEGDPE